MTIQDETPMRSQAESAGGTDEALNGTQPVDQSPSSTDATDQAPAAVSPEEMDADALRAALQEATRQAEEYLGHLRRERADFANYRRRVEEERLTLTRDANLGLLSRVLLIVDDFERAVGSAAPEELESGWAKGVQLIQRNLQALLASEGVERVEAEGAPFDPREHEAVSYQPAPPEQDGTVLYDVRAGYRKGDRVIRPAQVVVARAPDA